MSRALFGLITILCLLSVSSIVGLIQVVKADSGPIYINPDGSITPPTAPIYTADKVTYTLTGDITTDTDGIVIERNNIVLNGAGHMVTGNDSNDFYNNVIEGINLTSWSGVTVRNMTIRNFAYGIGLNSSSGNTLSDNNLVNNFIGIFLRSSSDNNALSGNTVTVNNWTAIAYPWGTGIEIDQYSSHNTLFGNTVSNEADGIIAYSSDNTLSDNTITTRGGGSSVTSGVHLDSSGNTLSGNNISNWTNGIFDGGSGNIYSGNTITGTNTLASKGIFYAGGAFFTTTITDNNITNFQDGIYLVDASYATVSGNNIAQNSQYGIILIGSSNCSIYRNNFVNNAVQADANGFANIWDDGSRGNYWDTYLTKYPNATQIDGSGVWNTPYVIDTNNTDHYPLTTQYVPEFPSIPFLPLFMAATLLAIILYRRKQRVGNNSETSVMSTIQNNQQLPQTSCLSRFGHNFSAKP